MHVNREGAIGVRYNCVMCGARQGPALKRFSRTYTPPWVYITLLLGIIPAVIIAEVVSTQHHLAVPFCDTCSRRHDRITVVNVFAVVGVLLVLALGGAFAASVDTWAPFGASILLSGVIIAAAARFVRNAQPKYLKFDASQVVIHHVVDGPVVLVDRFPAAYPASSTFN